MNAAWKRIVPLVPVLVLAFFVACGGGGDDKPPEAIAEETDLDGHQEAFRIMSTAAAQLRADLLAGGQDTASSADRFIVGLLQYMSARPGVGMSPADEALLIRWLIATFRSEIPNFAHLPPHEQRLLVAQARQIYEDAIARAEDPRIQAFAAANGQHINSLQLNSPFIGTGANIISGGHTFGSATSANGFGAGGQGFHNLPEGVQSGFWIPEFP